MVLNANNWIRPGLTGEENHTHFWGCHTCATLGRVLPDCLPWLCIDVYTISSGCCVPETALIDQQQKRVSLMLCYEIDLWSFKIDSKCINQPQLEQLNLPHLGCQLFLHEQATIFQKRVLIFLSLPSHSDGCIGSVKPWFLTEKSAH